MNEQYRELLFIDLCGRIPYKVRIFEIEPVNNIQSNLTLLSVTNKESVICITPSGGVIGSSIDAFKPYLFPMSSMTEEQKNQLKEIWDADMNKALDYAISGEEGLSDLFQLSAAKKVINWFIKNHFDMNGLIPKGLAIDATGLNIY